VYGPMLALRLTIASASRRALAASIVAVALS
jgi:hypothetical protein